MFNAKVVLPFPIPSSGRDWQLYRPDDEEDESGVIDGDVMRDHFAWELAQAFGVAVEEACATGPTTRNEASKALHAALTRRFWPKAQDGSHRFGSMDSEPVALVEELCRRFERLFPIHPDGSGAVDDD